MTAAAIPELRANRALYRRLLRRFRAEQREFAASFRAARARGDREHAMRLVHDLHGLAGTLGMPALREAAQALKEACLQDLCDGEVEPLLEQAAVRLDSVLAGLQVLDDGEGAAS